MKSYTFNKSYLYTLIYGICICIADSGCGRSEDAIIQEFNDAVEKANYCEIDSQCTVVFTECPLGCYSFVNIQQKESIQQLADDLKDEYAESGSDCIYSCLQPGTPVCVMEKCTQDRNALTAKYLQQSMNRNDYTD